MMQLDVWNISGSGFHFGRHGLEQEVSGVHLPSDSLFAALTARLAALDGPQAVDAWGQAFRSNPPWVASSAFPRAGGVRFFPTPLRTAGSKKPEDGRPAHKFIKRLRFVSEGVFRALLNGGSLADLYDPDLCLQNRQALLLDAEMSALPPAPGASKAIWAVEQRPRVTIGREAQNSTLYFTGRTQFAEGCGLWFAVRWFDPAEQNRQLLGRLLADLADAGLGGERASGFGQATIVPAGELDLPEPAGNPWVALSRYLPHPQDLPALLDKRAAYNVETVGGWVESPGKPAERRRGLRMLAEGAVLGPLDRALPGQMADVQPDYAGNRPLGHPVWRNGQALAVGFAPGALEVK